MVEKCNIAYLTDGTIVQPNQTTCGGYTLFDGNYYRCHYALFVPFDGPVGFSCQIYPQCTPPTPSTAD